METWKPVICFEGLYEISNLGRIKRVAKGGAAQIGKILAVQIDKQGYARINLCHASKGYPKKIHRLVAESFIAFGAIKDGMTINHKNGVKSDNRLENLEIVTRSENIKHAYRELKTQSVIGEKNPRAILNESQVLEIRDRIAKGHRSSDLAREFGVSKYLISDIKCRRSWIHI